MHLFNIMSGRWDGGKSNLVPIRSIRLTQRQRKKTSTVKKVTIVFFNLIYYWLSSKNFHSVNEIIVLVLLFPLSYSFSFSKVGVWWCQLSKKCVTFLMSPDRRVRRNMKTEKKNRWLLLLKFFETISEGRNRRGWGLGVSEEEKTKITDRNTKAWKHNFLIRG